MGIGSFGPTELIIALVIILLLFGAKRIPELARGLGTGVREFKRGTRGDVEKKKDDEALTAGAEKPEAQDEQDATVEADKAEQRRN